MLSVHDPEWDSYGWRTEGLPKEYQPDRKAALREEQARRLREQGNLGRTSLGDQEADREGFESVTLEELAEGQTNG